MVNLILRNEIFEQGFTQAEVCRQANVRPEYVSMHMKGRYLLRPDERKRIAKVLKKPGSVLFPVETYLEEVGYELINAKT